MHGASLAARDDVDLVGVWGRDAERTGQAAAELGTTAYASAEALFADVDLIAFAVPPHVQAPLAAAAARAGCHLLLEKPVATDPEQGEELVRAVAESGVATTVLFTRRFVPETADWIAQAQRQGGWTGAHLEWVGNIFTPGNPFGESVWRKEQGALWDVGPHALSLLVPVLGAVESVSGRPGPGDTSHLVLRHSSGATSTATLSLTVPPEASGQSLRVYGEHGRSEAPSVEFDPVACHGRALDALAAAAAGGPPAECDVRFGLQVTRVLAAAEQALRSGAEVKPLREG